MTQNIIAPKASQGEHWLMSTQQSARDISLPLPRHQIYIYKPLGVLTVLCAFSITIADGLK